MSTALQKGGRYQALSFQVKSPNIMMAGRASPLHVGQWGKPVLGNPVSGGACAWVMSSTMSLMALPRGRMLARDVLSRGPVNEMGFKLLHAGFGMCFGERCWDSIAKHVSHPDVESF